jgi:hypothetical protein
VVLTKTTMEQYTLERARVPLGLVTRGAWDRHQGSWHDWGWLEPAQGSETALGLLAAECRLHDEAVQLELAGSDSAGPLAEAALLQAEFMRPGVVLVSLVDGSREVLEELHTEAERVYWR